jgi:tetratricopeptide (TPR) repeat protein
LQKALSINPGLIDASNWLHNAYQYLGKPADAGRVVMDMIDRDPLYRPGVRNAINTFIRSGRQELALAHLDRIRPLIPNDATMKSSEAVVYASLGQIAKATQLIEASVVLQASNSVSRVTQSYIWLRSQQYERIVAEGEDWPQIAALTFLGRTEEASILAFRRADELADVGVLFGFLNIARRSDELITYLENRWPDLDSLRTDFPSYGGFGDGLMINVALAYSRAGNSTKFNQAMQMVRFVHDEMKAQGQQNYWLFMNESSYHSLAGDLQASLDSLERAIAGGYTATTRIALQWPALEPLEGDPRFEAIQARMIEHLNAEREKLGLEPVTT